MRKKAYLIPISALVSVLICIGTITLAGAGSGVTATDTLLEQANELRHAQKYSEAEKLYNQVKAENPGSEKALEAQKQLIHLAIDQRDQKKADASFNQMVTEFAENTGLAEAVYEIGKDYQYSIWNTAKANQAHNYNIEHFPDTKYSMLSNVELIRSYIRDGKSTADAEADKWMNTYKDQPDRAMGIYLIARAYAGNNKAEKALQLFEYNIKTYPSHVYGLLSKVRYETTNKDYDAADKAADKLIASSPDNEDIKENIRNLAEFYRDKKDYARAAHFYKAEITNWPDYDQPVVPYREAIYCYINMKDISNADALIGQMQTDLAKDPKLARTNFDIGNYFLNTAKDNTNALKIHRYNAEHYPNVMEAMWSQAALIWYYVRHNDQSNADAEYAKLINVYKGQETLPKEIFQIADIYRDEKKNYDKALSLYKYQLENWPDYGEPTETYRKLACTYIAMKDITNADSVIGQMQEKFAKNPKLARANFDIGNYFLNDANDSANALKIHKYNADNYTNIMEAMWSQAALVWYHVRHDDQANADIEYAKLLEVYKDQQTLPKEIFQIGDIYREKKKYDKAISLYKYQLDKWPNYGEPVDIYRKMACTYIDMKDIENADAVIAQMQEKFAKNTRLARMNFDIGNYFLNDANDPANALKVHKYNADNYTNIMESMWSQAAIVWYHVRHNDNDKADEAYAKLLEVFKDQKTLAKEVFQIADIYTEVGNTAKAIELAEYTIGTWPDSEYKLDAQKSIVKAQFESNDFTSAEQALDELIADNAENDQLPQAILTFGEDYYKQALKVIKDDRSNKPEEIPATELAKQKSKGNLTKSKAVWLRTISAIETNSLTADSEMSAEYYHYAGTCCRELEQYEQAVQYYRLVVDNYPEYTAAASVQGLIPTIYTLMKNKGLISDEEADSMIIKSYQEVIEKYPDSSSAKFAENKIKHIQNLNERKERATKIKEIPNNLQTLGSR